jgi:hypothetical protein
MNRTCSVLVLTAFAVSAEAQTTWNPVVNMGIVGYSDSFSRTVVRTKNNAVYYCMNASGMTSGASSVKIFKGNGPVPTSFTEMDSAHEPTDSSRVIGVDCRLNSSTGIISIVYQLTSPLSANYITYDTNADIFGAAEQIASVNHAPNLRYLSKVSLALDANGFPHVTYGGDNEGFSYNNRIGGTWHAAFQITTNFDDMHPSMTFGTDGVLHLAWMNFDSPRLILYRERSTAGTWSSTETVDGNVGTVGDKVDQSPSIAVTIDNKPLILYHNQSDTNEYVVIKRRDAASSYTDVSPTPLHTAAGHSWALSVDANGNWYICGHRNQNTTPVQPECLTMTHATSTWSAPTLLINNGTAHDGSASMRYDVVWPGDQTHIDVAYHDENTPPDAWYFDATVPGPGSSSNSASAALSTSSLTFPNQTVGTTSSPQSVTVTSTGATNLSISSIAPPPAFSETDNCSAPLTQGTSCQINVTFTPSSSSGPFTGNVTITDNAVNSPQIVSVSGTGVARAFSISGTISPAAGGSGATVSLKGTSSATVTANSSGAFTFGGLANGSYTVTPSHAGETFSPASQTVTVNGNNVGGINFTAIANALGESLFTSQTPASLSQSDGSSTNYELGMAFSSGAAGSVTAIRFWKDTRETGTHTGHLWTASGQLLGTAIFSGETSSGWQQAALQAPVPIAANTQYIASVNTGGTYFVTTASGLASKVTNQDLSSVVGNNGLYGSPGVFPANAYQHSNYFRDVVFTAGSGVFSASGNISPAASGTGTTVTLTGTRSATATSDANGNYTFSGLSNGAYKVTPSKTGATFNPQNLSFTVNGSNITALDFAVTVQTGSVSGTISPVSGGSGATVTLSGPTNATVTADSNGNYTFSSLAYGSYNVTPSKTGFMFTPTLQPVTVNTPSMTGINFTAVAQTGSISGTISPASGGSGATLTLSGPTNATVTADSNGNYTFSSLVNGSYNVTPSKVGFTFTPMSQPVTLNSPSVTGINFTVVAQTRSISGTVTPVTGGSGATMTLSGSAAATTTTNSSGAYSFNGLNNGTYTITPSNSGYTFTPTTQTVTVSNASLANVNFTANTASGSNLGSIAMDAVISRDQGSASGSVTTPVFSTGSGSELLLALISTDVQTSSGTNNTVTSVTGAGLSWVLVVRTNTRRGTSEIWRAFAPSALPNVSVSASLAFSAASSMTVVSFTGVNISGTNGSGAIGAIGTGAGRGAPVASLTATMKNSWVVGVGNDWDNAIARTVGPNQVLVHSYLAPIGDTYWVQRLAGLAVSGTNVTINDTAPTSDQYNLSICEILPGQ